MGEIEAMAVLNRLEQMFHSGDKSAPLAALRNANLFGTTAPDWAVVAIVNTVDAWSHGEGRHLEDLFSLSRDGRHADSLKIERHVSAIWFQAEKIKKRVKKKSLNKAQWETVAAEVVKETGCGKFGGETASALYHKLAKELRLK